MLNQQTIEKLYTMKLNAMAEAFKQQMDSPDFSELAFPERFGLLVDRQWAWKENRRMQRLLKNAKLKINACVEDIDYRSPRGLDKWVLMNLISAIGSENTRTSSSPAPPVWGKLLSPVPWPTKPAGKASALSMPGAPGSIMTSLSPKPMAATRSSSPSWLKLNCSFWTTWVSLP